MITKIIDELYISGKETAEAVAHKKIGYIIYLSNSPIGLKVDEQIPIIDGYGENKPARFLKLLEGIDREIKAKNTPILIMCRGGISRSPTVAALYLFYSHKFSSFDEALEFVGKKSSLIQFNYDLVNFIKEKVIPEIKK